MNPVLVTGGTGHLGRDIVRRLAEKGHPVRVFARSPGPETDVEWATGDLATGDGLAPALQDVCTVINAATYSPARRGGFRPVDFFKSPAEVDVDGTRRILALCEAAGVQRFLHVSIVGLDDASLPYALVKIAGERLVRESSLSSSVVRAMPFYYLLERLLDGLTLASGLACAERRLQSRRYIRRRRLSGGMRFDGIRGMRSEIGGPEDLSCTKFARQYQERREVHRPVFAVRVSESTARGMGFAVAKGRRGALRWSEWLALSGRAVPGRGRQKVRDQVAPKQR